MSKTTLTPERRALYEQIALLVAGHRGGDVFAALADNLWQAAAFLCDSPEAAEKLIRDSIPDLVRDMRANWHLVNDVKLHGRTTTKAHRA